MQEEIKTLQKMNQQVYELQKEHCNKKAELKGMIAEIYLYGEDQVKEATGKDKITQKDKEYFAELKTLKLQAEVDQAYLDYKYCQENYKLKKMEFNAKYGKTNDTFIIENKE